MPAKGVARMIGVLGSAAALVAVGCGSGSTDSGGATSAATSTTASACVSRARAAAERYQAAIPLRVPDQPLDLAKVRGKTLYFLSIANNEFVNAVLVGYKEAAAAMGAKVVIYDGRGQAPRYTHGAEQAVAQADGIALMALPPQLISQQLAEAQAKGIPVVDSFNGQPDAPLTDGVSAHVSADYERGADALANWMLADSGCDAHAVLFQTPVLPTFAPLRTEVERVFARECGENCSFQSQDFDLASLATKLGPQVSSFVRKEPDVNYVEAAYDSMVTFVAPALAQSGSKAKLVSHDGIPSVLDAIRKDDSPVKATMAQAPERWIGWAIADALARQVAGQQPVDGAIPTRLVDKADVGDDNADVFPAYQDFQQQWIAAWSGGA